MKSSVVRELRAVQRFAVNLPVQMSWRAPGQADRPVRGLTRDISTRGMFVQSDAGPSQGQLLEFEIDLALDEFTPLVQVEGEGRVVRVECQPPAARSSGFAVHNLWFKLREPEEGQALPVEIQLRDGKVARAAGGGAAKTRPRRRLQIVPPNGKRNSE